MTMKDGRQITLEWVPEAYKSEAWEAEIEAAKVKTEPAALLYFHNKSLLKSKLIKGSKKPKNKMCRR